MNGRGLSELGGVTPPPSTTSCRQYDLRLVIGCGLADTPVRLRDRKTESLAMPAYPGGRLGDQLAVERFCELWNQLAHLAGEDCYAGIEVGRLGAVGLAFEGEVKELDALQCQAVG